jgi:carbonic anhydrase
LPVFFRGGSPSEGSEHTINGLHSAGEAHFVFTNVITKQVAVLAFFIVISTDQPQSAWGSYVDNAIVLIREGTQIQFVANLMQLMETENNFRDFWRYNGSLTTPPCTEGVICKEDFFMNLSVLSFFIYKGTVFNSHIKFSYNELQALSLNVLHKDFRPTQLRNNRIVYHSTLGVASGCFRCCYSWRLLVLMLYLIKTKPIFLLATIFLFI